LSPLLSNVALSVLDEHFAQAPGGPASKPWERAKRRRLGLPNHRLVRFADDWVLTVAGTRQDAEALREQAARVLSRMGLRLSEEKTLITQIDEGVDFLGWRIQRHRKRGTNRYYVYTYPSRKALRAVMARVKTICRQVDTNHPLDILLLQINPVLRGWTAFFRPGVSSVTFQYLDAYVWRRVIGWIRRKHRRISRKELRRRYCDGGWWPRGQERELFHTGLVRTTRYRYRGSVIPSPWPLPAGQRIG
jgi:RNA-directed DNA polymerase